MSPGWHTTASRDGRFGTTVKACVHTEAKPSAESWTTKPSPWALIFRSRNATTPFEAFIATVPPKSSTEPSARCAVAVTTVLVSVPSRVASVP